MRDGGVRASRYRAPLPLMENNTMRITTEPTRERSRMEFVARCECGWHEYSPLGGFHSLMLRSSKHVCPQKPAPLLVHIYDLEEHTLISENIDIRLAFPQIYDMDYVIALYDIMENDCHICGGGASPAFLIVPAHLYEPAHKFTGEL